MLGRVVNGASVFRSLCGSAVQRVYPSRRFKGIMMSKRNKETTGRTVVGLFHSQADAERAIQRLKQEGFSEDQIGVALKDRKRQDELIEGTGTQAAEGAATG